LAILPRRPFIVYDVLGGTHSPHHPTPEWIKKVSDMHLFDGGGNKLRDTTFENQKRLRIMPADAKLTPRPKTASHLTTFGFGGHGIICFAGDGWKLGDASGMIGNAAWFRDHGYIGISACRVQRVEALIVGQNKQDIGFRCNWGRGEDRRCKRRHAERCK